AIRLGVAHAKQLRAVLRLLTEPTYAFGAVARLHQLKRRQLSSRRRIRRRASGKPNDEVAESGARGIVEEPHLWRGDLFRREQEIERVARLAMLCDAIVLEIDHE